MAAKSSNLATGILNLIFNQNVIAELSSIFANSASPATTLYLSLHTAAVVPGNSQSTNECTYTPYARVGVARNATGFTVSGTSVLLMSNADFPACTSGTETASYFAIGTASTGAGQVLYSGPISPAIAISPGTTPQLTAASSVSES